MREAGEGGRALPRGCCSRGALAQWSAALLTLAAVWLVGGRDVAGQWLMLAAQAAWMGLALHGRQWALAAQSAVLGALTVRAIVLWSGWGG